MLTNQESPARMPAAHYRVLGATIDISDSDSDAVESVTEPDSVPNQADLVEEASESDSLPGHSLQNQLGLPENKYYGAHHLDVLSCGASISEERGKHWFNYGHHISLTIPHR
jgi:hypothetical protein